MASYPGIRGMGGAAFTLGPAQNVFTGADRSAAEAARDAYALANPAWLAIYDEQQNQGFLNIRLDFTEGGNPTSLFQTRDGSAWRDNSSATGVKGDTGPAGATGNSYFFASIAKRDTFFSTGTNVGLLETGLPCTVNNNGTTFQFEWTGADAPAVYDPTLWRAASLGTAPGSVFLGEGSASISNGNRLLNHLDGEGDLHLMPSAIYSPTGTTAPEFLLFTNEQTVEINSVSDQTLASPQVLDFPPSSINSHSVAFIVIPKTSGELRVRNWVNNPSGSLIVDQTYNILPGDIDTEVMLAIPNPQTSFQGDNQYVEFSGVDLAGGLQTTGIFAGQTVIFLRSTIAIGFKRTVRAEEDVLPPAFGTLRSTGSSTIQNASIYTPWVEADEDLTDGTYVNAVYDGVNPAQLVIQTGGAGYYQVKFDSTVECSAACPVEARLFINNVQQALRRFTFTGGFFLGPGEQTISAETIIPLDDNDILTLSFLAIDPTPEDVDEFYTNLTINRIASLPANFDFKNIAIDETPIEETVDFYLNLMIEKSDDGGLKKMVSQIVNELISED